MNQLFYNIACGIVHKIRRENAAEMRKKTSEVICGKRNIKQNRNWFYFNFYQMVLLAQMKRLSLKTQQRLSVFGTCFDVSNIIISHYEQVYGKALQKWSVYIIKQ